MEDKTVEKKKLRKKILLFLIITAVLGVLIITGIYQCPFRAILGIPCPSCGLTRSYLHAARLDFKNAFYYHPLWPVVGIALVIFLLYQFNIYKFSKKFNSIGLGLVGAMMVICYAIRLITGSIWGIL